MICAIQSSMHLVCILLLCISSCLQVHAEQKQHHVISMESLLATTKCSSSDSPVSPATGHGSTLQVVHRVCSPAGNSVGASDQTVLLRRDHYRVRSIHRRLSESDSATTVPARLGLPFRSFEYVVTIGIGTPRNNITVLFDTGSDITWVQCQPCQVSCYPQQEPIFDPHKSSTYSDVSCSECTVSGGTTKCAGSMCFYGVEYGDKSASVGLLARETFTLSPRSAGDALTGIVFGCSEDYKGFAGMKAAGLLGLGQGASSIVSQTRGKYNGAFAYCLPPFAASTGYLTFGGAATSAHPNVQYTPLKQNSQAPSFYFVGLIGITVGGVALSIPPDVLSMGSIIDSGTVVTRLPPGAYAPLRDEFKRQMSGKYPEAPALENVLDTCYNLTGYDNVTVPPVALEFDGGARIDVDASGILFIADIAQACLAFMPYSIAGVGAIVGNMQQRAYSVVYDVAGGRVGFGVNGC